MERVSVFKFLGLHLGGELTWKAYTIALIEEAQQRLHFLRILQKNNKTEKLLVTFDRRCIESVLTNCILVWFTCFTAGEKTELQRVINTAQKIIGCTLCSLEKKTHPTQHTWFFNCCPR